MIGRLDRNGNGMIDPDENTGFAAMILQRAAQADKSIDLKKPVPLSKLTEAMSGMRGGRGGPSGDDSDEPELLVPDFSLEAEPLPPESFSSVASIFTAKIEDRDIKEAEERIRRYDQNKDNKLSKEELARGRWSDDPMQYDRNKDGYLIASELASRYATRRVDEEERRESMRSRFGGGFGRGFGDRGGDDGWNRSGEEKKEDPYGDAKSFRTVRANATLPSDLNRLDKNGNGQIEMNEFSSTWNAETLGKFLAYDLNNDGVIVPREANGDRSSSSSSSGSSSSKKVELGGDQIEWAKRQIAKYDRDGDGALTEAEWKKMLIKPVGADANKDGVLTVEEYAAFRSKK